MDVERSSVSWTAALMTLTPRSKPMPRTEASKAKAFRIKAKAKGLITEAKAKDLSLKTKAKDVPYCPGGQGYGLEDSNTDCV